MYYRSQELLLEEGIFVTGARCRPPCCQRLSLPLLAHGRNTHQKCRPGVFPSVQKCRPGVFPSVQKCRPGFFHRFKSVDQVFSICSKVPNIIIIKSWLARFCSFHHRIKCQLLIMSFTSKSILA